MVIVGKFVVNVILRVFVTIIAFLVTILINYMYCKETNKEFTFAKFMIIFSIILFCSLPLYFTNVW